MFPYLVLIIYNSLTLHELIMTFFRYLLTLAHQNVLLVQEFLHEVGLF